LATDLRLDKTDTTYECEVPICLCRDKITLNI